MAYAVSSVMHLNRRGASPLPAPHADGTPIDPSELPTSLPAYMIYLVPELRVDGAVVATGGAVTMGAVETMKMSFSLPNLSGDVVKNKIEAGEYWGIAINGFKVSRDHVSKVQEKLADTKSRIEVGDYDGITRDDIYGDKFYATALLYNLRMNGYDNVLANSLGVRSINMPSEAVFKSRLSVTSSFGVPVSAGAGGLYMDVDRQVSLIKAFDGDDAKKLAFLQYSGINSSAFEHMVPEQLFEGSEAISAVKAIKQANDEGIPIYRIDKDNAATTLAQLQIASLVKAEIENMVNAGYVVTVPKMAVSFHGKQVEAFVAFDPETGSGAYMISTGDGGAYVMMLLHGIVTLNPVLVVSGYAGFINKLYTWAGQDMADFLNGGTSVEKDWCGSYTSNTSWVPDKPFGIDLKEACKAHDECYGLGGSTFDKFACDLNLFRNSMQACSGQTMEDHMFSVNDVILCEAVAGMYSLAVVVFGYGSFNKGN